MSDRWFQTFSLVSDLFNDHGIEYIFIKMLTNPPLRTDVDVMITNPSEEARALELLRGESFSVFKAGVLAHPRRRICRRKIGEEIDIYPDASWDGWKVANGKKIMSRRIRSEIEGKGVWLPSPSDSLYLIVTHAYSHLRVRSEEIQNCTRLISERDFSWDRIYELASEFGTVDAVYLFLRVLVAESNVIPREFLAKLSRSRMGKWIDTWLGRKGGITFPLEVPWWLGCFSSFSHVSGLRGKVSGKEIASNFLWHYTRVATKAVRGR